MKLLNKLISKVKEYYRDMNNLENYLAWGFESQRIKYISLDERYN